MTPSSASLITASQESHIWPVAIVTASFSDCDNSSSFSPFFFFVSAVALTSNISLTKSFSTVLVKIRASPQKAFVYAFGVISNVAVTRLGRMESFTGANTVFSADGVKGVFMAKRESFVTCAFRADEAVDKRGRG